MKRGADEYGSIDTELGVARGDRSRISLGSQTFTSFKNPVFRLYYGGMLGQMAAMTMQMVTRSLLIYRLTGSAAILGGIALAFALPMLFLSLFGGVIADRVQKKYVLITGQAISAVASLGVAITLTTGLMSPEHPNSWWILAAAGLVQGTVSGLMMPSRQTIIREIVSEEQLMNAVALNTLGMNTLRLLAPAATGFLIDRFDFQAVYYAMAGTYLMAVVFITFMPLTGTMTVSGSGTLTSIKEGLQYIRGETTIILILVFTLFVVVLSMPYMYLLPLFTEDILKVGATGMGVLLSIAGVGAMVGSLILASLPNKKRGLMLLVSSIILSLALVGFSFSNSWSISLVFMAIVGLGQTGRMTLSNTLLQYYVKDEYRGRVMSIYMMEFGLMSLGTFAAGLIAEAVGAQWALGGFAIVLTIISALAMVFIPRIRKLD